MQISVTRFSWFNLSAYKLHFLFCHHALSRVHKTNTGRWHFLYADFVMSLPAFYNYSPVFPNPLLCLKDFATYGATELNARLPWNGLGVWLSETWHWIRICVILDWYIVLLPLLFFVGITAARIVLNKVLIHVSSQLS